MKLTFKSTGSTANYVTWLKGFKDIMPSLLIEVDLESKEFIAKSFPSNKNVVKYSTLSFDDAGLELTEVDAPNGLTASASNRVMVPIYNILGKLIEVENMFSETEHEMVINFDICNTVRYITAKEDETEYQAVNILLKSMSLTMETKCSDITNFFYKCDDNTFLHRVCNIGNPSTFTVSLDTLNNLAKISSIYIDPKVEKPKIKFYSKVVNGERALYAKDDDSNSYDYLLGYLSDGADEDIVMKIVKINFLNGTKGITDENLTMTFDTAGASRVVITTNTAKIVVAAAAE